MHRLRHASLFLVFYLLSCFASLAQISPASGLFSGTLLNREDETPIPFANIYLQRTTQGTSTNEQGQFALQLSTYRPTDTLVFSSIGYQTRKLAVATVLQSADSKVYLLPAVISLNEVAVTALPAVEIIRQAMARREANYWVAPHKLSGIFRIADQEDGAYVRLLEAAIDVYDSDYMNKNSRLVDYRALRQSKDYRTFDWRVTKHNARNAEELLKPDFIKRPTRATHPNGFEKGFSYAFERYTLLDDETVYVISATRNPALQWPNYDALFYVRASDLAILRVDRDYTIARSNWMSASQVQTRINSDKLVLIYRESGDRLHLSYLSWTLQGEVIDKQSGEHQMAFQRMEELSIHSCTLAKRPSKIRTAWHEDIYQMTEPYQQAFWQAYPVAKTHLFEEVSRELRTRGTLQEQFQTSGERDQVYTPDRNYRSRALQEDLALLRQSLEEAHPALYRYSSVEQLDALFEACRTQLSKRTTELEFYQLVSPIIAAIRCGHTQIRPSKEYINYYQHRAFYFPLQIGTDGGQVWLEGDGINTTQLRPGDELISINGLPLSTIIKVVYPHLPVDGQIATARDHLFTTNFPLWYSLYVGYAPQFELELRNARGQLYHARVKGISYASLSDTHARAELTNTYRELTPDLAWLRVTQFADQDSLGFKAFVDTAFDRLARQQTSYLIIDLRDNSGGRDDYAIYLYAYLSQRPFVWHRSLEAATDRLTFLSYTDQEDSFNEQMLQILERDRAGRYWLRDSHPTLGNQVPQSRPYTGQVYFLINGGTFSAAADFAAIAREHRRGQMVGQETGGAMAGNTSNGQIMLTLPHTGIRLQIPLFKVSNAVTPILPDRGVIPDFPISYEAADVATGRDKEVDFVTGQIDQ